MPDDTDEWGKEGKEEGRKAHCEALLLMIPLYLPKIGSCVTLFTLNLDFEAQESLH